MSAALPGAPVLAAPAHDHAAPHGHPAPTLSSTPAEPAAEIAHPSSRSSHSGETLTDCDAVDLEKADKKSADGKEAGGASDESQSGGASKGPSSPKEEEDPFLVTIKGRESLNPHTWAVWYRWAITGLAGLLVLNATFASSAPSNLIASIITHFNVSQEVGILLISVFVAGYCLGPLLWGPLSERYGRRLVFLIVWLPYIGFQVGCALAPNIGALIVFRFLGGCFAAAPLTVSGGAIADLWDADRRGDALAVFALMPFAGPALAPIISGAMQVRGVDWYWIFWTLTLFAGACGLLIVFFLPETYVPYILVCEAKRLRKETGDDRWHAALEKKNNDGISGTLKRTVLKPFIMLFEEPMLLVITLYMSLVYGVVYLLFEAIPIVFEGRHGLNPLQSGLVFLALLTGGVLGVVGYVGFFNRQYMKIHRAIKPRMVPPEERLKPLLYAAPLFAVSFFWFGWTGAYRSISIWSPILSIVLLGACVLYVFLTGFNYLIDCYLWGAASALSINTVVRSSFGAGFPLFTTAMYNRLGIQGACSLLGGLAILFVPIPFLLIKYGKKIRGLSKNAVVLD
ncbi:major facilitator superfamily domain-containing protein [Rhodotorula diobovata]|uniref:Major facilitator superfamily domain-containing protein n=1 Tax=Rhodotorula diobovata TaxID=5288 RepID=A0A5C5G0E7_9BASI|nr:major facilitator superfamily domain-containing protein [Rhodotorula diobovata]